MRARIFYSLLVALVASLAVGMQAQAQEQVGHVEKIATVLDRDLPSVALDTADVRRVQMLQPQRIVKNGPFLVRDLVQLYRPVDVHMRFEHGVNKTDLFLYPGGGRVGAYEVLPDTLDPLTDFQLAVKQGELIAEHYAGRFVATIAGFFVNVDGTKVLFRVDEPDSLGFVYLSKGSLSFPQHGIRVRKGKKLAWNLVKGSPPQPVVLSALQVKKFEEEVKYHSQRVWGRSSRPWWQRPKFYIPAAAVVTGGIIYVATRGGGGDESTGIIVIPLPD